MSIDFNAVEVIASWASSRKDRDKCTQKWALTEGVKK